MSKTKKILFFHGFFAKGQCVSALALQEAFRGKIQTLALVFSIHSKESLVLIMDIYDREKLYLLVGNSCGLFYAQMVVPIVGIPHLQMTKFLKTKNRTTPVQGFTQEWQSRLYHH